MLQTYEKIPTKVKAVQLFNTASALADLKELMGDKLPQIWTTGDDDDTEIYIFVPTFEGKTKAVDGDFITKDINGEFFVYKPELFNKIYRLLWD